jgi:N-methylhydantoinase A
VELEKAFELLAAEASQDLSKHGVSMEQINIERVLDARYKGQRFELRISLPDGLIDESVISLVRSKFHEEHRRTYGRSGSDELVEFVNLRLRGKIANPVTFESFLNTKVQDLPTSSSRPCRFTEIVETPVINRAALSSTKRPGPLIVEDMDATTLVPPGASAHVDAFANIVISWEEEDAV